MAFFQNFYIYGGAQLTSNAQFVNAAIGDRFQNSSGVVFEKTSNGVFTKVDSISVKTKTTRTESTNAAANANYCVTFGDTSQGADGTIHESSLRQSPGFYFNPSTNSLVANNTGAALADLAEKYIPDVQYTTGTVVEVGGTAEITEYNGGSLAGVISDAPGLRLNVDSTGQFVALKGKVPVKTNVAITKGQYCVAANGGVVIGIDKANIGAYIVDIVGIALEDSVDGFVMVKV